MADTQAEETKKTPEVELDTDDVKAENVEVKESKETKEPAPNLNVGEVDLGYTDHVEKKEEKAKIVVEEKEEKTEAPQPTEQPKDDLSKITDNVQKRIDKLTYRAREAERREKQLQNMPKDYNLNLIIQWLNLMMQMRNISKNLTQELMHNVNK